VAGGDGARRATEAELEIATNQGENFASILNTFTNGKQKMLLISQKQENNAADSAGLPNKEIVTTDIPNSSAAANPPSDDANGANDVGIATTAAAVGAGSAAVATAVRGSSNTTDATINGVTNASTDPTGASNKLDTAIGGVNNNINTTVNGVNDRDNTAATSASNGLNSAVTDTKNNVDTTVDGISNKFDTNNTTSVPDPASATAAKLPTAEEINISPNEQTNGLETNAKEPMVAPEILPDPVVAVGTTTAAPATVSATVGNPVPDSDAGAAVKAETAKQETKPVVAKPTVTTEPKKKKPWFCCG
jgi:hypothetical protein